MTDGKILPAGELRIWAEWKLMHLWARSRLYMVLNPICQRLVLQEAKKLHPAALHLRTWGPVYQEALPWNTRTAPAASVRRNKGSCIQEAGTHWDVPGKTEPLGKKNSKIPLGKKTHPKRFCGDKWRNSHNPIVTGGQSLPSLGMCTSPGARGILLISHCNLSCLQCPVVLWDRSGWTG